MKSKLSRLREEDRADLALFLIESLDERTDADAESAWDTELERRAAEIRAGSAMGKPAEDVFAKSRGKK